MIRILTSVALIALLAGCDGEQPFTFGEDDDTVTDDGGDGGDGGGGGDPEEDVLDTGTVQPPGAEEPSATGGIIRLEAGNESGGGVVSSVAYNASNDTFTVDGIGFDGANIYARGTAVAQISGFAIYDADIVADDILTGEPIGQIVPYRAIYGVSQNTNADGTPRTAFAIVRSGGYVNFGFGGFVYERNGEVVLPGSGQAQFTGNYAGIRVFQNLGGLEYTSGEMRVAVDFEDFDTNAAVQGRISNRVAFDINGDPVPLGGENGLVLPDVTFSIQQGTPSLDANGEIRGEVGSVTIGEDGTFEAYETGTYYGIIAGDTTAGTGGELVGVVVMTSEDPRFEGVTAQETGGFILYQ